MFEHRVVCREVEPAADGRMNGPQLVAVELYARGSFHERHARQAGHEVEMPERSPEFAVGCQRQPDLGLHVDRLADGRVLDLAQGVIRGEPAFGQVSCGITLPRFLHCSRTQQASNMIGAKLCPHPTPQVTTFQHSKHIRKTPRPDARAKVTRYPDAWEVNMHDKPDSEEKNVARSRRNFLKTSGKAAVTLPAATIVLSAAAKPALAQHPSGCLNIR